MGESYPYPRPHPRAALAREGTKKIAYSSRAPPVWITGWRESTKDFCDIAFVRVAHCGILLPIVKRRWSSAGVLDLFEEPVLRVSPDPESRPAAPCPAHLRR